MLVRNRERLRKSTKALESAGCGLNHRQACRCGLALAWPPRAHKRHACTSAESAAASNILQWLPYSYSRQNKSSCADLLSFRLGEKSMTADRNWQTARQRPRSVLEVSKGLLRDSYIYNKWIRCVLPIDKLQTPAPEVDAKTFAFPSSSQHLAAVDILSR